MGKCIKCGTSFVGTPENPPVDALCKYCEIDQLKADLAAERIQHHAQKSERERLHKSVLEQLKNTIRVIDALIDRYVDGSPDASAASQLANQIHNIIHP